MPCHAALLVSWSHTATPPPDVVLDLVGLSNVTPRAGVVSKLQYHGNTFIDFLTVGSVALDIGHT